MTGIKGIVILTRFDYIETNFGKETLKSISEKLDLDDKSALQQPIGISKDYPEIILKAIDDVILSELFKGKVSDFLKLGNWNARQLLPRYFQVYADEKNAAGFLSQMMRMRHILIGLGEMHVTGLDANTFWIRINYGQPYMESVRLSELGFLEEACRMCGAANVRSTETERNDVSVEYEIKWDSK